MRTRLPSLRTLLASVAFALASTIALLALYWAFDGAKPLAPKPYTFSLALPDTGNLLAGSDVQMAGVDIGSVQQVRRAGDRAQVTVGVKTRFAPIGSGTRAILRTKTLQGEAYIELAPGPSDAPPLPEGGALPASQIAHAVSLDSFMKTFNPEALRNMRRFFEGSADALRGRSAAFNEALGRQAAFTEDLAGIFQTLDRQRPQLRAMFANSAQVMRAFGARVGDLQAAIRKGNELFDVTARRNRDLAAMMRELPPFLAQVRATSRTIADQSGDFNRAMRAFVPAAEQLQPAMAAVRAHGPGLERLFRRLPATMNAGTRGFPALQRILRAMPPGFEQLDPTLREYVPFQQLLTTYSVPGFVRPLANTAATFNGTQVGPQGKILVRGGGLAYNSNESIAGWIKRLPEHRSNPYPTPTAFDALAEIGFLKSFDCRHIRNPGYLPPTGSGVPPCDTQGPWIYRGTHAYYPRLEKAPPRP